MNKTKIILTKALKISSIYFALILGIPLVFFSIVLSNFYFFPQQEVMLFPLDDHRANYTITYKDQLYVLEYKGRKSTISTYAYITSSPVVLEPYIGKEVIITGEFTSSDRQCIMAQCTSLSTKWAGVDIETIKTMK